jgi:hypothetical protein
MSLKMKEEPENVPSFETLMEEDSSVELELICFASNIKKDVCEVLNSFFSFLKKIVEIKTCNMLALTLDPRFKSLCLVSSFIGCDQAASIVQQYDTMSLYPMFMKCYYHLHPSIESNNGFADKKWMMTIVWIFFKSQQGIFKKQKSLLKRELLVFQPY